MIWENLTTINHFTLLGLTNNSHLRSILFVLFLSMYWVTLIGNFLIIFIVYRYQELHTPMYLLLSHFSVSEICYTTNISPNMLVLVLLDHKTIGFIDCMIQLYLFLSLASVETFLLTTMSYDRYLAICKPLHYHLVMSNTVCRRMALVCWVFGFLIPICPIFFIHKLHFCGSSRLNHFFCDSSPLLSLSCTNTNQIQFLQYFISSFVLLISFLIIAISYVCIIFSILTINSPSGRRKAFSTCASHLTVLGLFFIPGILIYVSPLAHVSVALNKWLSLFYTELTPLLNPFVYSLRNREIKEALKKSIQACIHISLEKSNRRRI
ncbi:hypothetical protein GDO86_001680 [Hymenochirus boettgeri]|uniref:Olfactory receptor n=1 Tax=Hymenochirus boettgeri TaxID=247094 RepID=A0A8T2KI26_9PIPI|nr:hypothetical protein GDO86_001680 [Hymenochirus boettgeri]